MDNKLYRLKMVQVANKLKKENVDQMKYLYSDKIGDGVLETIETGLQMIKVLENHSCIGPDNLEEFMGILNSLDRPDLVAVIKGGPTVSTKLDNLNAKLEQMKNTKKQYQLIPRLCDRVSFSIGINWRRFGRHLNLNEAELEHIDCDYRKTQDKAMAVLSRWKQKIGEPTWEQLEKLLATFQRYDIIREVEREFNIAPSAHQGLSNSDTSAIAPQSLQPSKIPSDNKSVQESATNSSSIALSDSTVTDTYSYTDSVVLPESSLKS